MEDEITLEIENTPLKCNKTILSENSDYFKAMFGGNFSEGNKSTIKLEGIDMKSMQIILKLLWDKSYEILDEDILMVLQTACMLQFEDIRENCVDSVTEKLSVENCLKVWFMTEPMDLKHLWLKAKNLALMEFLTIKDLDCILELNLIQLHSYLSNIKLDCGNEMEVFQLCMKWFYNNVSERYEEGDSKDSILLSLFNCVDFRKISQSDINEMVTFPNIHTNKFFMDLLNCIAAFKRGDCDWKGNNNYAVIEEVVKLFSGNRRDDIKYTDPLMLVKSSNSNNAPSEDVYHDDSYKRKRKYMRLENLGAFPATVVIYDRISRNFLKCMDIPKEKYNSWEGFHIIGYKEQIFVFGGEVVLGSGHWNYNFWVYDTIREKWERKTKIPFGRRHFQSCISGNFLFVIGGTGSFRIIQDNMFWYNYKQNVWSKQIMLPCAGMQTKSCGFRKDLLILHLSNRCGYLFKTSNCSFELYNIADPNNMVWEYPDQYTIFEFEDKIYIKGSSLIGLQIVDKELKVISYRQLEPVSCDSMESVICRNLVYTLYKYNHTKTITIEIFSMETFECNYLVKQNTLEDANMCCDNAVFDVSTKLFSLRHHFMIQNNVYINPL